jgi:two-component system NarL family response regulator
VLLLQWSISCVETLRLFQTECPTTKVLILISCSDAPLSFQAISEIPKVLAAGAWGAVSIDDSAAMVVAAIHAIAQGQRWSSPYLMPSLMGFHELAVKPKGSLLTTREQQVLELMVTGKTDKQIARSLNIGERTVRDRLHSIYNKLDAPSRVEAAVEAMRRGLVK